MTALLPADAPILVFIGPSGVGKSTLVAELVKQGLVEVTPTWTDRPRRADEVELEHKFVSSEEFDEKLAANFFVHPPLTFFGLPYRYATPRLCTPPAGVVPTVMARFQAIPLVDKLFPERIIYQIEAPQTIVAERLEERAAAGDELGSRLDDYETEVAEGRKIADRIFVQTSLPEMTEEIRQALRDDFQL